MILGIDASRNRSGGAKAHVVGILENADVSVHGIERIHVWAYSALLDAIPDRPWLTKHCPRELEAGLASQLWWQATKLDGDVRRLGCDVLFATDASTLSGFQPLVVLSQDMLSYEPGVMRFFGFGKVRMRLIAILAVQNLAFWRAKGVIFLTRYAGKVIQASCGRIPNVAYIPHGIDSQFKVVATSPWPTDGRRAIRCVYVSPVWEFKHQWVVVRAIEILRRRNFDLQLVLIGHGSGAMQRRLDIQISESDPDRRFVEQLGDVAHRDLPTRLADADIFVFASSCENLPITLLEAMAVGLPIACSNRGPMPEVLRDGGVYFDPEDADSIATAIQELVADDIKRCRIASRAKDLASQYSWARCSGETLSFIAQTVKTIKQECKK